MTRARTAAVTFAATCGFLAGMAVMAVLVALFGGAPPGVVDREPPSPAVAEADRPLADTTPADGVAEAAPDTAALPAEAVPADDAAHADIADAPSHAADPPDFDDVVEDLRRRRLDIPVQGVERSALRGSFDEQRGAARQHEAMDVLAPRHTPVVAVEAGVVARLFTSKAGGITVYQFDPTTRYTYYYAHLERYADGLAEGAAVARGQVLGYVGTSGNAPPDTPHLHFAIFVLGDEKRWWEGTPIDPFAVFRP